MDSVPTWTTKVSHDWIKIKKKMAKQIATAIEEEI